MTSQKVIKNIIFDFGGVLLDIDFNLTYSAIESLLDINIRTEHIPPHLQKILDDFETGKINVETFLWNLQHISPDKSIEGFQIITAWNAMLLGWDVSKFDLLIQLKEKYNVFLLSNTNELHMDWVYRDLQLHHKITDFDRKYFTKTYYSHLIQYKKPDQQIFKYVTEDAKIDPGETLFIDDLKANVIAARKFGWIAYHHIPKDNLLEICINKLNLL